MNESNASIVGVRRLPRPTPARRDPPETEKTVAKTIAQSEMQPLIMRRVENTWKERWKIRFSNTVRVSKGVLPLCLPSIRASREAAEARFAHHGRSTL